ncbi:MAG TPA: PKD domain-containing protein, partial [Bacteroidales bacterium]|nr:PKD domain-containing protein [Bacteroidales bacterium]
MNKLYSKFLILTLTILCFGIVKSQTPISICPQVTTYSSMVRGYHFTAPCNFTICGLYVPPDASSGLQSVAVVRFNAGPPPAYSSTTNNFVQLFYQPNWPTNTMIPCNINVSAGQIIGVYGARGGSSMINSYGQAKCMTNILGYSVMLERSGMQYDLSTQPMHDIWSEVDYYIGRIIMYINCCPTASFTATNSVCLGAPVTVTYTGSGTAGVANFNWTFNNGSPATANTIGPHSVTWSTPGTYNIDLSVSQSGCTTVTSSQQIVVNPLPNANAGPDVSICQGQSTTLNGTGGNSFNWSNGATTPNITVAPTTTTTYTLTVTGIGGCTATDNVVVTVNNLPTANAGPDVTICQGETTTLNASGGGTYLWSNQATTSSITVSPSTTTTYTVTVTSAVGCSASDAVVVTVNPLPTANAGPDISICAGTSTVLNASGGSSYQWNTGSTNSSLTIAPLSTTTYIVTVYNSLGCSASDDIIVTVLPIPNANAGPDQSICLGSATTLTASGGIAYLWSTNQTTSQISVTPNQTTTYTVTVIDINTCTATDNVIVNVYTSPPVSASNDTSTCQGNPVILTAAGGNTYLWSTSETTASISVLPSTTTTYTVTVTDINGCSGTDNVVVTVNPIPLITASPSVANICIGDSITLNATGGISYTWAPSVGLSNNSIPNPVTSPSANITYTVTGYNQYGCTNSANVNITVEAFPLLAITPSNATICSGQSINLTASGASTYNWSPSTGLSSTTGANVTASPTITTTYT